jgi:hypothetical protein
MRVLLIIGGIVLISAGVFGMASGMFNLGSSFQATIDAAVQGPQAEDLCKPGETLEEEANPNTRQDRATPAVSIITA